MSVLGNLLWLLLGGLALGLGYMVVGLIFCITVIGIPFGVQLVKIGSFAMWPFGNTPELTRMPMSCLSFGFNLLWILLGGIVIAVVHAVLAAVFYVTIIGIPFGNQHLKLAKLALIPFGQSVVSTN